MMPSRRRRHTWHACQKQLAPSPEIRFYSTWPSRNRRVSVVLVVERAKEHVPIYYISHVLARTEVNYPLIKKFAYMLVMASRELRPYFEVHMVAILTD